MVVSERSSDSVVYIPPPTTKPGFSFIRMATNYKALTRAYRPQSFDDIISQEHVSDTLKNAIERNRLSHAYLFCGPRGVGKTTMARVLARTVNAVDASVDAEDLNNTLNIVEIDAASNNSVDDIRALRERVRIPPQNGRFKIYIIDEVHMLSKSAFNALLKTLEEPPAHVIFIFATTEPHKILPTILSRCQRFDFRRITTDEIVQRLSYIASKEQIHIDEASLHVIARKADGALRDALSTLDQVVAFCGDTISYEAMHNALNIVSEERLFEMTQAVIDRNARAGITLLDELLKAGNDIQEFLSALTEHFRNLYLARDKNCHSLIEVPEDSLERYTSASASFSEDDLMRIMHMLQKAQFAIRQVHQPRIHLEIALLKLFHMTRNDGLAALLERLDGLENNPPQPPDTHPDSSKSTEAALKTQKKTPAAEKNASRADHSAGSSRKNAPMSSKESGSGNSAVAGKSGSELNELFGTPTLKRTTSHLVAVPRPNTGPHDQADTPVRGNLALSPQTRPVTSPRSITPQHSAHSESAQGRPTGHSRGSEHSAVPEPKNLQEFLPTWTAFLHVLQEKAGSMLWLTLQRARPASLKKGLITLECQDPFTSDVVKEQQRRLSDLFREQFGLALRFQTKLVEQSRTIDQTEDIYARFARLQKEDPRLGKLITLFGAEPEY